MLIKFKFLGKDYSHDLKYDSVKIYSVPEEYSPDMIYIADYPSSGIEPYPSSDSSKTKLLYHAVLLKKMNDYSMMVKYNCLEEVSYAKD